MPHHSDNRRRDKRHAEGGPDALTAPWGWLGVPLPAFRGKERTLIVARKPAG